MSDNRAKTLDPAPDQTPDVPRIMAEIRNRIKASLENGRDKSRAFKSEVADGQSAGGRRAGELLYSEELKYLNSNYTYGMRLNLDSVKSHRPGIIGKLIVKCKQKLLNIIWHNLLQDYFAAEKEYQANLVRFLNDVSKYVDARDASNFWELIKKIDYDVTKALERIERINDEQVASARTLERHIFDSLNKTLAELNQRITLVTATTEVHSDDLRTVNSIAKGLEGIVSKFNPLKISGINIPLAEQSAAGASQPDYSYLLLENRYRGSEQAIAAALEIYPPIFKSVGLPVLELGPGRGELQSHFKAVGIKSYGVDTDPAMVQEGIAKGLDLRLGDGIAHLRGLADRSLGGVIATQVVEHLPRAVLEELVTLCAKKVVKGGRVVFETINPRSLLALSSNYFRDPTHVFPVHPDTLSYTLTLAGLKVLEVKMLSPVPEAALLKEVRWEDYMTPRWTFTLETLNHNLRQLNELLYGYQDYCVVAEV